MLCDVTRYLPQFSRDDELGGPHRTVRLVLFGAIRIARRQYITNLLIDKRLFAE